MDSKKVKQIVSEAFDVEPGRRESFVRNACGADGSLLSEALSLLEAASAAGDEGFLPSGHGANWDLPTVPQPGSADPSTAATADAPLQFGRYKVLERIGEGGMGIVYRAEQRVPIRREVVVKVIKLGMDTKLVIARFEAERQALAMMDHPHIARVYDAGADDRGRPYFVMEYVKGTPILDYCDRNHLTVRGRMELFMQVCQAIQHAHHKGIIHRDIKPSNILVSTQDGKAFAKVIDFGIAKATSQRLTDRTLFTEHVNMIGTPAYMSPEQADGNIDIDTRTDVYSLGVVLYELLTGHTPFDSRRLKSAALNEIARIIRDEDPPKPSTRVNTMDTRATVAGTAKKADTAENPGQNGQTLATLAKARGSSAEVYAKSLRGEVDWMVMKAIEKDRARRYDTPNAMAEDIGRFLGGAPVLAAPPTVRYRIGKFTTRYRAAIVATATIAVLLLAGVFISSWQALRARAAEREVAAQLVEVQRQKSVALEQTGRAQAANQRAAQSEQHAVEEATGAKLLAHYVSAQYMMSQGRLAPAYAEIATAIKMRPSWEYGYLMSNIVDTARGNWEFVGRIDEKVTATSVACFCGRNRDVLAVAAGKRLRLFETSTGHQISDVGLDRPATLLTAAGFSELAVADTIGVAIYSLTDPAIHRSAALETKPLSISCDTYGKHLAAYCTGGEAVVLNTSTMNLVARHRLPAGKVVAAGIPSGTASAEFSPSGRNVLLFSGVWTNPTYLWDWSADQLAVKNLSQANFVRFADEQSLVSLWRWESATATFALDVTRLDRDGIQRHYFDSRGGGQSSGVASGGRFSRDHPRRHARVGNFRRFDRPVFAH